MAAVEQLSGVTVVIIIAICVEALIILFITAKRQIMRFSPRSRRGPHWNLAQGAPKTLRRELERRFDYISYMKFEPPPSYSSPPPLLLLSSSSSSPPPIFDSSCYRHQVLCQYNDFEKTLVSLHGNYARLPTTDISSFLLTVRRGPLSSVQPVVVNRLCRLYRHARHHYTPFTHEDYVSFLRELNICKSALSQNMEAPPVSLGVNSGSVTYRTTFEDSKTLSLITPV